ncbi:MAG: hypothetical protein ACI841_005036 [Planctomycetota bacterium]|jgi:hypothetical protein
MCDSKAGRDYGMGQWRGAFESELGTTRCGVRIINPPDDCTFMKSIALTLLSACTLLLASSALGQNRLDPSQMEEDLFALGDAFDLEHAGLRRFTNVEDFDDAFFSAVALCSEPRTRLEFFRCLSVLVAHVRCGHTRVQLDDGVIAREIGEHGLLPIEVHLLGERAFVLSTIGDGVPLQPGQELLSINGQSIFEIRHEAFRHMSGDGFIETGKQRALERNFAVYYSTLVARLDPERKDFEVRIAGSDEALTVGGISYSTYASRSPRTERRELMELTREAEGVERLFIRGFGDPDGDGPSFPKQLEAHFTDINRRKVSTLILDLRGNGGGNDMYGAMTVFYLSPRPFRYFERIEVSQDYEGEGGIVERDGMWLVTEHPGTQLQQPAAARFHGRAFLLTDGRTFSTAADVATVAHFNGLATLIGEESGGGYDGNTSGTTDRRSLPNSGISYSVPKWMYTTANVGHDQFGQGAPVHFQIRPTVQDILDGRDAEVAHVLELLDM